ncbi:MAG: isoprenylcysteine carboxylmethyltransferase family protein [Sphingomonas bacterium]|nr:isoprenylcysteine carboxylmethyltransferase family protein [Sphingomonas bacterium]
MTSEDNPRVFLPPPLIFGGLLALGLLMDSGPLRFGPVSLIGIAIGACGIVLIALALGLFRSSGTRPEPWQPASSLVRRGIYRFTRNPMYLSMAMLSLGIAMVFASLAGAVLSLAAMIIIDRVIVRREEAYLMRRFGADYIDYMAKVRRWL